MWNIGICLCLLVFASQAIDQSNYSCRTFSCGTIDHTGETKDNWSCLKIDDQQASVPSEICPKGYMCEANKFGELDFTKKKYICAEVESFVQAGSARPGDICTKDSHCYNYFGGASCNSGQCVTQIKEGDDCRQGHAYPVPDSSKCPVGFYCGNSFKCIPTLNEGEQCGLFEPCSTGLTCIGEKLDFKGTCQRMFKAQNGARFYVNSFNVNSVVGPRSYCESYNYFQTSQYEYECRRADLSVDKTEIDLRRDIYCANCYYQTWNDSSTTFEKPLTLNELPSCGYNVDGYLWCNKRIGDHWFQESLAKLKLIDLTKIKCHAESNILDCYDFISKAGKKFITEFKQRLYEVNNKGFAKIANNDKCVAKSITNQYWQGHEPNSIAERNISNLLLSQ